MGREGQPAQNRRSSMATLSFNVGRKGQNSVVLSAEIAPLSKQPRDAKIPFQVRLPDGRIVKGELDSPQDLELGMARIQLQHAVRDLIFPDGEKTANGKRGNSSYKE
jgi:hypothetical protein